MTPRPIAAIAVALVASLAAPTLPAWGQAAPTQRADAAASRCVPRNAGEPDGAWSGRARAYCEIRWRDLVSQGATGRWKHPDWIGTCLRRCRAGDLNDTPTPYSSNAYAAILSTAAGVALATAAATSHPGGRSDPPDPPVSP